MNLTLVVGFSSIAGLLAGFFSARLGPKWLFPSVLGLGAMVGLLAAIQLFASDNADAFIIAMLFGGIVIPFVVCVLVAGLIGLLARRFAKRSEAE